MAEEKTARAGALGMKMKAERNVSMHRRTIAVPTRLQILTIQAISSWGVIRPCLIRRLLVLVLPLSPRARRMFL